MSESARGSRGSAEDCAGCGHHVSFHESMGLAGFAPVRSACWHGRDRGMIEAVRAVEYAQALGLSEEDRRDFADNARRLYRCNCQSFTHAAAQSGKGSQR